MADYYPLIAKHILGLGPGAPGESRRAIYERARGALIAQLRRVDPPLKESEITHERLAFEEAVRKVEGEAAQRARADELGKAAAEASRRRQLRLQAEDHKRLQAEDLKLGMTTNLSPVSAQLQSRPVAPSVTIIPEQNLQAIGFNPTRRGPLDLVSDPPRDPFDPEQTILYQRIRSQLKELIETIPSQERTQIDAVVDDFLDQPGNWREVEFKKVLWLCGNSIRTLLTQHDAVKDDPEPHYSKLPPAAAEALRRPIQGWNVFVQTDPDLAQLDAQRLGPQEQVEILKHLAAAGKIIDLAVANKNITTDRAAKALTSTLQAANNKDNNINTRLTQDLADKTSKNFFSQILRSAYLIRDAIIDLDAESAKKVALGFVIRCGRRRRGSDSLIFRFTSACGF